MIEWLNITDERKKKILQQATNATGLPPHAIEKDWWVTLALRALFSTQWANNLVFKGGTSLSKAWGLIERFSEDIDLAIDREVLGFPSTFVSKEQVAKLRKTASDWIAGPFREELQSTLIRLGVPMGAFDLTVQETEVEDRDPQVLILSYPSCYKGQHDEYIREQVLIEIGARSLREPSSLRAISTILSTVFSSQDFAGSPFEVTVVEPHRTMLEKVFLLHEEFLQPPEKGRYIRLSRHLYDLERLMDTEHGERALTDHALYDSIIQHRQEFNMIRGLDYSFHGHDYVNMIPPSDVIARWEEDYRQMQTNMIYGRAPNFPELIERLTVLRTRVRQRVFNRELERKGKALRLSPNSLQTMIDHSTQQIFLRHGSIDSDMQFREPFTRMIDINSPEGPDNFTFTYLLFFREEGGALVFTSIESGTTTTDHSS